MSLIPAIISNTAATILKFNPSSWLNSWLLYLGIQTHVRATVDLELKPLHNIFEYLNALYIYADEAHQGKARTVESFHFCAHVRKDLRQCLIYDSCTPGARLIGIEYTIPREKFLSLTPEDQRLWHSHEFEVKSGMLVLPTPERHRGGREDEWGKLKTEAMKEVIGLYGKIFHTWQLDRDSGVPMGVPRLIGSLTEENQINLDEALRDRNERLGVNHRRKAQVRKDIELPEMPSSSDSR